MKNGPLTNVSNQIELNLLLFCFTFPLTDVSNLQYSTGQLMEDNISEYK